MRRYTVQVVGEEKSSSSAGQPTQPVQTAQPVSPPPSPSEETPRPRKFVVETLPAETAAPISSETTAPATSGTAAFPTPLPSKEPVATVPPAKESVEEPHPKLEPDSTPAFPPAPASVEPANRVTPPTEPPDYWESRQQALSALWQEEQLGELPENPVVKQPRREKEARPKVTPSPAGATLKQQTVQRIEGFYQKRRPKAKLAASAPSTPSFWTRHRRRIGLLVASGVIMGSLWLGVMAIKAEVKDTTTQAEGLLADLQQNRYTSAQERQAILAKKLQLYEQIYQVARPVVRVSQGQDKTEHLDRLFEVADDGLEVVDGSLQLYRSLDQGYRQFVGEEEGESVETFTHLSGQFESLFTQLAQLQSNVEQLGNPYHLTILDELNREVSKELPELRRSVLAAQKVSLILPELLGEDTQKTYLVLLQNNAELRPTGGFIGSFALLTIKDGRLQDFKVEDVYEADGQLNGFVTPPEEIVQYLNEEQWYLRDVNWSPDFPAVAQRASWFLEKSLGVSVDGVIAINLEVAQRLLTVTGPLEVVDYDQVITADNLYQQAQQHSELNFFPGSNGKKDFLSAVSTQILNKVFYGETNKLQLAQALEQSAEQAELFISFAQPQLEETFASLGWNGEVRTPGCPSPFPADGCFVDTVMQVEANVGVNKSNQFVTRTVDHQTEILADRVRHTRTIALQNDSASEAWPAGKYKVYLRLFVTQGSELRSLTIDGQPVDLQTVRNPQEDGKQVFGTYVEVPIKAEKTITFFYETPLPTGMKTYALFEQKQSGTAGDQVVHVIDVGEREVEAVAPEPQIQGRQLRFTSDHTNHQFMAVEF